MADKPKNATSKRQWVDSVAAEIDMVYNNGYRQQQRELLSFFAPNRGRFFITDGSRGQRKNQRIVNTNALDAISVLKAGMMAGITNPSTEWVRLTIADKILAESGEVKEWLAKVTKDMNAVFAKSNLYKTLPVIYGDMGVIGVGAMLVERDEEDIERFSALSPGSYRISNNAKGRVDTVSRVFRLTVRQVIQKFGFAEGEPLVEDKIDWTKFSKKIKSFWDDSNREAWVDVMHVLLPNPAFDPNKLEAKFKRYASFYYERGTSSSQGNDNNNGADADKFLRESGFDKFRILVPRWEINGTDAWPGDCPGFKAEGQQRATQTAERRLAQADEQGINPTLNVPMSLRKKGTSRLPGANNYVPDDAVGAKIEPTFNVNYDKNSIEVRIERYEKAVNRLFHKDAFVAISDLEGTNRTAFEIDARLQESRLMTAGVLVNIQDDLLEQMVDITFSDMLETGLISDPPQALEGMDLKVEFIGVLARAQKSIALNSLMLFRDNVTQLAEGSQDPTVWDKVNTEQLVDEFAEAGGVTPSVVVSDEEVAFIKEQRQEELQAQQQAEAIQSLAGSAKDLSQTDLGGNNALTALTENATI